ncbi:MAG: carboxyl transferase domain-containing protein [Roseitalea porphyridii]
MPLSKLLIANRGEIAIRIARAAAEHGLASVAVYSEDDAGSLHIRRCDQAHGLAKRGPAAYLDIAAIVAAAKETGCDAVHPGYGFLAENADFAARCAEAGLTFVGPAPATLATFGDKGAARRLAQQCDVPVLRGTDQPTTLDEATAFMAQLGPGGAVMLKAVAGGGGRGMRPVRAADELAEAYQRASAEAAAGFGNGDLYVEELFPAARHIEVQIAGDGTGSVRDFGERECSIQRRHQKLVEIAPANDLGRALRDEIVAAALRLAEAAQYASLGTVEFLVSGDRFAFIEANARLQVEHTVTEEVTGVDLVRLQFDLAAGKRLKDLDLPTGMRGAAIELRVNMETMAADGSTRPAGGTLTAFDLPSGPGVRVDTFGYAGYRTGPAFDSLLAKVIVAGPDLKAAAARAYRALSEFRIEGVATNRSFLQALLRHPGFLAQPDTGFLETHLDDLLKDSEHRQLYVAAERRAGGAGARIDNVDPLAVLAHGKAENDRDAGTETAPDGTVPVPAPMQGTVVTLQVAEGDEVYVGKVLMIMEAMKMQHEIAAEASGTVRQLAVAEGDTVFEGDPLAFLEAGDVARPDDAGGDEIDLDHIRPDLADVLDRQANLLDPRRPEAVERRRRTNQRTARENIDDLIDPGSFQEYGGLMVAAQRERRTEQDLINRTQADGMIAGFARINGDKFGDDASRAIVISYDYTVMAGTQGVMNHAKKDRMFELAAKHRLPVVFYTEGGGGRPGDTDLQTVAGLHNLAFQLYGELSGLVPLVGVNAGYCFAGNAAILGCCDVIIATANSNIGMGGPAMIEGGGLGVFRPTEVGPMRDQVANGVVDIAVEDEAEATRVARKYLSYFQGPVGDWDCADQRLLRRVIPEDRLRVYEIRDVIETLCDTGSVLELRKGFGVGMVTALARIEGRPIGIIANNPKHLGGAVDSEASDKGARFLQLCDAFDIPVLSLTDTPGFMVGPEVEKTALVRHCCRLFVTGANISVPLMAVILRKSYGLGAQAMVGGSMRAPLFTVAWPTGEFGGMGLEGAVKLGYRKELEAIDDPEERRQLFDKMVARMYERGKALSTATYFEFDDVIDPADTRKRIVDALRAMPPAPPREGKKRPFIDTW